MITRFFERSNSMKVGKLIHTITFYTTEYISNGDGTGEEHLKELRRVKCSIEDIGYKTLLERKKEEVEKILKVHTYYFKEFDTNGLKAKINADLYEVIYRENVSYKNTECIFTISRILN